MAKKETKKTKETQKEKERKRKERQNARKGAGAAPPVLIPALPARPAAAAIDYSTLQPLTPKPALAVVVGAAKLLHSEASRKVWAYVRRKRLLDPKSNKIKADPVLRPIFRKPAVSRLEMTQAVRANLT